MQSDRAIRNARMVQAYQHARCGHETMARIYASSAAAVYPLTGGQRRRLERLIKEGNVDWKAEALARVRRTRLHANNLRHEIGDVEYSLCELGGYDDEYAQVRNASYELTDIIKDLFDLEGRLSRPS